jgi:hypothetical protein
MGSVDRFARRRGGRVPRALWVALLLYAARWSDLAEGHGYGPARVRSTRPSGIGFKPFHVLTNTGAVLATTVAALGVIRPAADVHGQGVLSQLTSGAPFDPDQFLPDSYRIHFGDVRWIQEVSLPIGCTLHNGSQAQHIRAARYLLEVRLRLLQELGLLERAGDGAYRPTKLGKASLEHSGMALIAGSYSLDPFFHAWSILSGVPLGVTSRELNVGGSHSSHERHYQVATTMLRKYHQTPPSAVIALGAGNGGIFAPLMRAVWPGAPTRYFGVDLDPESVASAATYLRAQGYDVDVANEDNVPGNKIVLMQGDAFDPEAIG